MAAFLMSAFPASAQLVTENAGTISPETPLARLQIRGGHWEDVDEVTVAAEVHYGFHPRVEGSLTFPVVRRVIERGDDVETIGGLGDVAAGLKINVYKTDGVMTSTRAAVLIGVEAPTGEWRNEFDGETEPFARKLQPGSGTWDFSYGVAFTSIHDRHRFAADLIGRASTERSDVRPGPQARLDAAYWFRLLPATFEPGSAGMELRLVLDASAVYRWRTHGGPGDDSGLRVWLSPGAQFYALKWLLFEANVSLPLYDGVEDEFGDARWEGYAAVKILF
jgi:hypothetical protein